MNNREIIEAFASESKSRREEAARCFLSNWISYFISRSEQWRIGDAARQDVQQNICLKVLVHAGSFRGTSEGQAVNWIRTIAEREFNSYWRKNFPQNASPVAYVETDTNSPYVEGFDLDTEVVDDTPEDLVKETVTNADFSGYLNSVIERGELTPEVIRLARANLNNLRRPVLADVLSGLNAELGDGYCLARFKEFSKKFPRHALALVLKALGYSSTEIARILGLASAGAARVFVHGARKRLLGFFSQDNP